MLVKLVLLPFRHAFFFLCRFDRHRPCEEFEISSLVHGFLLDVDQYFVFVIFAFFCSFSRPFSQVIILVGTLRKVWHFNGRTSTFWSRMIAAFITQGIGTTRSFKNTKLNVNLAQILPLFSSVVLVRDLFGRANDFMLRRACLVDFFFFMDRCSMHRFVMIEAKVSRLR